MIRSRQMNPTRRRCRTTFRCSCTPARTNRAIATNAAGTTIDVYAFERAES
jgi:hypothetical protein